MVSHPAKQANVYHRPRAAERAGITVRFLTGLYYRPDKAPYSLVAWLPEGKRREITKLLEKRRIDGLDPGNVISLLGPSLELVLRPLRLFRQWDKAHDWLASQWIARHLDPNRKTVLHGFQGSCLRTFRTAGSGALRLLEVTCPPFIGPGDEAETRRTAERGSARPSWRPNWENRIS